MQVTHGTWIPYLFNNCGYFAKENTTYKKLRIYGPKKKKRIIRRMK